MSETKHTPGLPPLVISFSGGRTSGYMLLHCLRYMANRSIVVVFANTGCEHPATLDFVDKLDKYVGGLVVWLEGVTTHERGIGMRHKVVSYETASRNGEPFEEAISKYGIFGPSHPNCTGRLKTEVIDSYLRSIGLPTGEKSRVHHTAIGIRADEIDRISPSAKRLKYLYPLIDAGITKEMVSNFWRSQPFDLELPGDHYGNCVWCWKKSFRKHLTLAKINPSIFDFPLRMETKYGTGDRTFFRGYRTTRDILEASQKDFIPYSDDSQMNLFANEWDRNLDLEYSCAASCDIGEEV